MTDFFRSLKETTRTISREIEELKEIKNEIPTDESIPYQKVNELSTNIRQMQTESQKLLGDLKPKLSRSRNYFLDIQDLIFEIEEEVIVEEKHLEKYGYKPIKENPVLSPKIEENEPSAELSTNENVTGTPTVFNSVELQNRLELENGLSLIPDTPSIAPVSASQGNKEDRESDRNKSLVSKLDEIKLEENKSNENDPDESESDLDATPVLYLDKRFEEVQVKEHASSEEPEAPKSNLHTYRRIARKLEFA